MSSSQPSRPWPMARQLALAFGVVLVLLAAVAGLSGWMLRGTLAELATWAGGGVRGEITLVIEGAVASPASLPEALDRVRTEVTAGRRLSEAVADVAAATGVPRRELYDAALKDRARPAGAEPAGGPPGMRQDRHP